MKLALGLLGVVVVGSLAMGCSPTKSGSAAKSPLPYWEEMPGATTTLTNATIKAENKKLLIPYVNFDDPNEADDFLRAEGEQEGSPVGGAQRRQESDALDPENVVMQTWGAPYQAYEGYDSKLGF